METDEDQHRRFDRTNTPGLAFLRTMVLLNGGAILALLIFMGNASTQTFVTLTVTSIQCSIKLFLIGITSIMIGLVVSYIHEALAVGSRLKKILGASVISVNTICSIISLGSFFFGVTAVINGAQATP